ncbi:hypothetical protein PILCRDRAFT_248133 [Piloderma croceum F 1598]|uniref:Secreted protein n=1 Tax=Piloderma croceum (strain F 1598) TaxID=765440 RepID=A0A0C3FUS0_PILCF|nr:hypothetical protein PILCRDRAFT_248133 [Piloderma croceum F 1598]
MSLEVRMLVLLIVLILISDHPVQPPHQPTGIFFFHRPACPRSNQHHHICIPCPVSLSLTKSLSDVRRWLEMPFMPVNLKCLLVYRPVLLCSFKAHRMCMR